MKLIVFIICFSAFGVLASNSYSQTKLTLNMNYTAIKEVLNEIENNSEFFFLYNNDLIDVEKKVNIEANQRKITDILDMLFDGQEVEYLIMNRQIIISPRDINASIRSNQVQVKGKVTNESGESLPGVTVIIKGTTTGTNNGTEWSQKNSPLKVDAYDFLAGAKGVAIPYGVYDMDINKGWANVGITKDTAEFAVQSIRNWWYKMGIYYHNNATSLLITADGGGSNSPKGKLWKFELQKFSNETGMKIEVVHFPPGTSKWNKIEHRLFSYISKNWRGKPLISYEVIIKLISSTKTTKGLDVECEIDNGVYKTGINITKKQMGGINIIRSLFHGEWNYSILPQ